MTNQTALVYAPSSIALLLNPENEDKKENAWDERGWEIFISIASSVAAAGVLAALGWFCQKRNRTIRRRIEQTTVPRRSSSYT